MSTGQQHTSTDRKRPKDRADRIREAATRLFHEHGYHDVAMAAIGAETGITASAVYRHFGTKEQLLIAVIEHELTRLVHKVRSAAADGREPVETLRLVNRAIAHEALEERAISTMYVRDVRNAPFEDRAGIRVLQRELTAIWSGALRGVRTTLTQHEAEYIVLSSYGVLSSHFFFDTALSRRRLDELLSDLSLLAQLAWRPADHPHGGRDGGFHSEPPGDRTGGDAGARGADAADSDAAVAVPARASRREMILQAAVGLMRRHGYRGVGIDGIGAAAGISGPGVYRHFRSKDDILLAAYQRAWEQMMAGVSAALDGEDTPPLFLSRLVDSYVDVAFTNSDLILVYLRETAHLDGGAGRELRHKQRLYVDEWVRGLRAVRGELDDDEARARVHAAFGVVNSAVDIPTALPPGHRRAIVVQMVTRILLGT